MPTNDAYEFSDLTKTGSKQHMVSNDTIGERSDLVAVKKSTLAGLVVLGLLLAAAVGLIVHFAVPRGSCEPCSETPPTLSPEAFWAQCVNESWTREECLPGAVPCVVTTTPPTAAPPLDVDIRLPTTIVPSHYDIYLKPDFYHDDPNDFKTEGWTTMHLECKTPTNEIVFHVNDMTIDNTTLKVFDSMHNEIDYLSTDEDKAVEKYTVLLSRQLTMGERITLRVEFTYPLREYAKNGLHWNKYPEDGQTKYMLATQFEPVFARRAFPCLDEPSLKATFNVTLMRKKWMVALTNGPLQQSNDKGEDWMEDVFKKTDVVMPTYLVAFAISNFSYIEDTSPGGLTQKYIRFWGEPRYILNGFASYAKQISAKGYDFFEELFDHPYSMPKTDQIQVPDFASGAMENWGLITYAGSRLLYDPKISQQYEKQRAHGTIMHELLHQWLGNVVTCSWWGDIWLNEAFARYYQHWAMKHVEPSWDVDQIYTTQSVIRALSYDSTGGRHPIYNPDLNTTRQIRSMFSSVSYDKGGAVLRMAHQHVMKDSWNASMRHYLDKMQYKAAGHDDLFAAWEETLALDNPGRSAGGGINVTEFMYTWIKQSGYPVVSMHVEEKDGQTVIQASQNLYLMDHKRPMVEYYPSPYNYQWDIPCSYVLKSAPKSENVKWMIRNNITIELGTTLSPDDWVLGNYKQYGFYRVNYNERNWKAITKQLDNDHRVFDVVNRGQIIDDAFNLARAGLLNHTFALDTIKYMSREREYLPWFAARSGLYFVDRIFVSEGDYVHIREFMRHLLEQPYKDVGWEPAENEPHPEIYHRELILELACQYGMPECIEEVRTRFDLWKENPDLGPDIINPNLKDAVYCTAIENGDSEDWDFLLEQYIKIKEMEHFSSHRAILSSALTCTTQIWMLQRLFLMAMNRDERVSRDSLSLMIQIARNPNGNLMVWEYLNSNWSDLSSSVLMATVESYSTDYELEKVEELLAKHPANSVNLEAMYTNIREVINHNIRWRKANEKGVFEWFKEQNAARVPPIEELRLPPYLVPYHYNVVLKPDIYQENSDNFTFDGNVEIYLRCQQGATSVITVHFRELEIDNSSVQISSNNNSPIKMSTVDIVPAYEFYKIHTNRLILPGEEITVAMSFSAKLKNTQSGMYWSDYPEGGKISYMVATQFEASDARKAFPCLDEPALKASFNITLHRKSWMISLSNSPLKNSIPGQDNWVEDVYEQTAVIMPTYLVAFAVANYTFIEDTTPGGLTQKKIRYYAEPRYISAGFADYAKEVSAPAYDFFETLFNHTYNMPKTDQIQIPDFAAGAMENWGLITYRGARLLLDPELTSEYEKQRMAGTIYHELLHQWIGNVVTCAWWSDIWLNEAFARYYQHWALRHVNSDWDIDQIYAAQSIFRALAYDDTGNRHPLHNPVLRKASDFDAMFTAITYDKGGSVLRMAHHFIMRDSWNASMQLYIDKMQYKAAEHDDLFSAWEQQLQIDGVAPIPGVNVTHFMYTWILQMGYPVVTLTRSTLSDRTRITASQEMFLSDPEKPLEEKYPSAYNYKWEVPLSYVTNSNLQMVNLEWMHLEDISFDIPVAFGENDWILANHQQYGFYRVNYDTSNWDALIKQLQSDFTLIDILNRGQLLDDSFELGRAGSLAHIVPLEISKYLRDEPEYLPWYAAKTGFSFIDRIFIDNGNFVDFRAYIRQLVQNQYDTLGWDDISGDSQPKIYLRELILTLACQYGHEACISHVKNIFTGWLNDPLNKTIVRPDVRGAVYCTAIENGGETEWNFLFEQYTIYKENDHFSSQRTDIRDALACSRHRWILERYFKMAMNRDDSILSADRSSILYAIARNPNGNPISWEYLHSHTSSLPSALLSVTAESYSTEYDLNKVEEHFKNSTLSSSIKDSVRYNIKANMRWRNANENNIFDWLSQNI